jgi:hypothetical protein
MVDSHRRNAWNFDRKDPSFGEDTQVCRATKETENGWMDGWIDPSAPLTRERRIISLPR